MTANAQATQTAQTQATATANAQTTATAIAQTTQTAQAPANTTANAQATQMAQAQGTATTQAVIAAINAWTHFVGSPAAVSDGRIDCSQPGVVGVSPKAAVSPRNFFAEAQFFNPTDSSTHPWDYGFFFRSMGTDNQYRLIVYSDKRWRLMIVVGTIAGNRADEKEVARGTATNLDVSKNGTNLIDLVVNDQVAYFFLNGLYIATLDVSERNIAGNIFGGSAYATGYYFPGYSTPYRNFVVRSLP